jgi:hypothetical protein
VRAIRILIFVSFHEAKASQTSHSILSESLVISPIVVKLPRASPGVSPKLTASHRSLRRRSEHSERRRSFGETPKLRSGSEHSESHRSSGETPILRRSTEAPVSHRSSGAAPKRRRDAGACKWRRERTERGSTPKGAPKRTSDFGMGSCRTAGRSRESGGPSGGRFGPCQAACHSRGDRFISSGTYCAAKRRGGKGLRAGGRAS